jgi:hypothetical protein
MKLMIITATVLATLVADSASAGPLRNAWNRQQVSIGRGLIDGSLGPREAIRLERRAISIRNQARFLRWTGGGLGPRERAYLGWRLMNARAAIYRHRHN